MFVAAWPPMPHGCACGREYQRVFFCRGSGGIKEMEAERTLARPDMPVITVWWART